MARPNLLLATWSDGVLAFTGDGRGRELAGRSVRALGEDHRGTPLAIVDGRSVCRRRDDGTWRTIATTHVDLACITATGVRTAARNGFLWRESPCGDLVRSSAVPALATDAWWADSRPGADSNRRLSPLPMAFAGLAWNAGVEPATARSRLVLCH